MPKTFVGLMELKLEIKQLYVMALVMSETFPHLIGPGKMKICILNEEIDVGDLYKFCLINNIELDYGS